MRVALPSAASLLLLLAALPAQAAEFHWEEPNGVTELMYGDQPVLRYMAAYDTSTPETREQTFKVYHHVFGPGTGERITKGPGGLYTHHRGLFLGWMKTGFEGKSLDFWHGKNGAHQRHVKFLDKTASGDSASMTSVINWEDAADKPVIVETRTVTVHAIEVANSDAPAWQIDWSTKLESRRGEITLDGDRQHAGFQFRADQPVAEANGASYLRPANFPQQGKAIEADDKGNPPKHIDLGWFGLSYELNGERYNVEYFDNPDLPKPSLFSERPYGRFGTFFKTTLKPDQPLNMEYRVIVSHGEKPSPEAIQKRYDAFLADLAGKTEPMNK